MPLYMSSFGYKPEVWAGLIRSPENLGQDWGFKLLVSALIILGMLGFVLSLMICQYLQRVLHVLLQTRTVFP